MLFDWLVVVHVLDVNPAHAVRGPKYQVKKGKTPLLTRDEACMLLDSIAITRKVKDEDGEEKEIPFVTGLRDRALIGTMLYTFARIGAAAKECRRLLLRRVAAVGSGCMRKATRNTRPNAITTSKSTSTNTSTLPASRMTRTGRCSAPLAA